jgi:putative ABC transport system substrate-binding protein
MVINIARRKFISAVGGTVGAWPLAALAQTSRRLGVLFGTSAQAAKARGLLDAVTQGLNEYGWVEGRNITFEYRFADGKGLYPCCAMQASIFERWTSSKASN